MPAPKKTTRSRASTNKSTSSPRMTKAQAAAARRQDLTAIILFALGIFLFCVALISGESLWKTLHNFWLGVFGIIGYFIPVGMIAIALVMSLSPPGSTTDFRFWQYMVFAVIVCGLVQLFYYIPNMDNGFAWQISSMYTDGQNGRGGGVAGALFGWTLPLLFGATGAKILLFIVAALFLFLITGSTLRDFFLSLKKPAEKVTEVYETRSAQRQQIIEQRKQTQKPPSRPPVSAKKAPKETPPPTIDIPLDDEEEAAMPSHPVVSEKQNAPLPDDTVGILQSEPDGLDIPSFSSSTGSSKRKEITQEIENSRYFFDLEKEPIAKEQDILLYTYGENRSTENFGQDIDNKAKQIFSETPSTPIVEKDDLPKKDFATEEISSLSENLPTPSKDTFTMETSEVFIMPEEGAFIKTESAFTEASTMPPITLLSSSLRNKPTEEEIEAYQPEHREGPRIVPFSPSYRKEMMETDVESKENSEEPLDDVLENKDIPQPHEPSSTFIYDDENIDESEDMEGYRFPPVNLLKPPSVSKKNSSTELQKNADLLISTLKSFGVQTKLLAAEEGPTVTRYEVQPSAGVKISKITSLADDIALNLAASAVRIEAPIPGKPAVGIEVPNRQTSPVQIREIIDSSAFDGAESRLSVALGKGISGEAVVADIGKMPHVLIAGATGSGKSVCINSIIISLLYKSSPDEVRLLMIDPKVVELGIYNGIPHLLVPVVTDPRKAAGALGWAVTEMQKRYALFAENNVRDLRGFNALAGRREDLQPLPQIVIIIDELADLMMVAPGEVEDSICRLAQMARAAGMHLVIATQRPSVDVITGIIKANIPTRIAFSVSSQVDSRTILDSGGAEKLLGRGDMLFAPMGAPKPYRVQGCFVEDSDVEKVVAFVKGETEVEYDDKIIDEIESMAVAEKKKGSVVESSGDNMDEMLPDAVECILSAGVASTSLLQRKLRLGYARAARIMDMMEEQGFVGPSEGSKPRQVLITPTRWAQINGESPVEPIDESSVFSDENS